MGPNGSGKSTLGNVIAGRDGYDVTSGEVIYRGRTCSNWNRKKEPVKGCSWRSSTRLKSRV